MLLLLSLLLLLFGCLFVVWFGPSAAYAYAASYTVFLFLFVCLVARGECYLRVDGGRDVVRVQRGAHVRELS